MWAGWNVSKEYIGRESDVEVWRAVESHRGYDEVTLTFASQQTVPVQVRCFVDVPPDRPVLDRHGRAVTDPAIEPDRHFDRLECHATVDPGERVAVRFTLGKRSTDGGETDRGRVDDDSAVEGDVLPVSLAAVVPVAADEPSADPAALWWAGDRVYRVPTRPSPDEQDAWNASPGSDRDEFVTDGGNLEFDGRQGSVRDVAAVPGVAVVATPDNHESVVRTVARARANGHEVYVTYVDGPSGETAELGADLGAVVVDPPELGLAHHELREFLESRAREDDLPGVVVQSVAAPRIDYDRTAEAFEYADFAMAPIPESWDEGTDHPHVVVGIPAYNAADTVGDVVERTSEFADVVLVVDDGSGDDTGAVARLAGAVVVEHERNRGYGGALKTAFKEADRLGADHLVVLDADGQHDPADVPRLVEAQTLHGAEIVIGSRYVHGSRTQLPLVRRVGLGVINVLTNLSLGQVRPRDFVHDTQSGFRAYDRRAIASLAADHDIGDRMGASTDIIYHAHRERYAIREVGTTISYDVEHASTLNPFAHGYDLVRNIFYTLTVVHPFKTLGVLGGLLASLGLGVTLEGLSIGIEHGDVPFVKTYAAALVALLGLMLVVVATDYHTLRVHPYYRRDRE